MSTLRPQPLVQAVKLLQPAAMVVADHRSADFAHGSTAQFSAGLPGQKKRTSSGSVRRWPNLRTCSSSERPDRRSEDGNLASFIRDSQAFAALGATASEYSPAVFCGHTLAESMTILAAALRWLVSSFHGSDFGICVILQFDCRRTCKIDKSGDIGNRPRRTIAHKIMSKSLFLIICHQDLERPSLIIGGLRCESVTCS